MTFIKSIICKDVFGNQYTVPVDELNIRVGVYAVIIEDNKILLTRQWDGYSLIGGGVEKGETIEESIVREVKEETGLTITPDRIIHQATTFFTPEWVDLDKIDDINFRHSVDLKTILQAYISQSRTR